jgi:N-acetylneuraminate synthase
MHCVLNYPTEFENAQLNRISTLIKNFPNLYIGYSDHTRPEFSKLSLQTAFALGARVFEKHFTFDKTLVGNDHYHSFNHEDGSQMVETLKKVSQMLKFDEDTFIKSQESARKNARRGMYASVNLPAGHRIGYTDVIALRPVFIEGGVEPQNMKLLIGKKVIETIEAGKPLLLNNLTD